MLVGEKMDDFLKRQLSQEQWERIQNGEPIQKVIQEINFYGYPMEVNLNVLTPSMETEELVSKTLFHLYEFDNPRVVDIGTGSGCIAIAISKEIPSIVEAVDINPKALDIARRNAERNSSDVRFLEGDMLKPLEGKYDCIVSNPPYLSYDLDSISVVSSTPVLALFAGAEGLASYEVILSNCKEHLNDKFLIALEIGEYQSKRLLEKVKKYLPDSRAWIEKDMNGKERFLFIREK